MVCVLLDFIVEEFELDAGLAEEVLALCTSMVFAFTDHAFDAAVDDKHGAGAAGGHATIEGSAVEGDAPAGSLTDGVLLGMYGTHTMLRYATIFMDNLAEEMAHIVAMGETLGRAYIACYQDLLVFYNDTTATPTVACGALADGVREVEEIVIP